MLKEQKFIVFIHKNVVLIYASIIIYIAIIAKYFTLYLYILTKKLLTRQQALHIMSTADEERQT